jgi:HAD superfamily hydrolase (TIGR01549 family)
MLPAHAKRPYILLDAGGTLVYPSVEIIRGAGQNHGAGAPTAKDYFTSILLHAGTPAALTASVLSEAERMCSRADGAPWTRTFWTYALPWTRAAVEQLYAAGYRMSVVSNSDGNVAHQMADLGLSRYFDEVFDSHLLGVEKPDPRIFQLVLAKLGLHPTDCLFIGDVFMVDVIGANAAGIAAVHLDPLELYGGWPGIHTKDLQTFADALASGNLLTLDPAEAR